MTKTEYRAYVASELWQQRRKEFLQRWFLCNRCGMPRWLAELLYDQDLHVHHKSYASLGQERDDDLEALCCRCHEVETFGRSDFPELKTHYCPDCGGAVFDPRSEKCEFCIGEAEGRRIEVSLGKRQRD